MKRSEFVRSVQEQILGQTPISTHPVDGERLHRAAELAADAVGITWEAEEPPKMLPVWGDHRIRLTALGIWEINRDDGNGWKRMEVGSDWLFWPVFAELRDRLLAERQVSSAMEQGFEAGRQMAENLFEQEHVTDGSSYRCGAFDTSTGEQCLLESDHEGAHQIEHVTDGSPCWCEPEIESPWHDEVERRLKELEFTVSLLLDYKNQMKPLDTP